MHGAALPLSFFCFRLGRLGRLGRLRPLCCPRPGPVSSQMSKQEKGYYVTRGGRPGPALGKGASPSNRGPAAGVGLGANRHPRALAAGVASPGTLAGPPRQGPDRDRVGVNYARSAGGVRANLWRSTLGARRQGGRPAGRSPPRADLAALPPYERGAGRLRPGSRLSRACRLRSKQRACPPDSWQQAGVCNSWLRIPSRPRTRRARRPRRSRRSGGSAP